ncbi:hypothetical protein M432DRAFT_122322 [Thermoascus aurantiacus ATCC 26904]
MYLPRKYRTYKTVLVLMAAELPFTIAVLTLTGIASPDLYRTKLWQDGADNGFNSAPNEIVYAYANYRTYKIPMVWSQFLTSYNLVIGVLSLFFLLTKAPMHLMRVFYPPLSVAVHAVLTALYIVSVRFQAGSDMSDPAHPQPGPPWYITKNCNVAAHKENIGYCQQAKSLFAVDIIMIVIFFAQFVLAVISCFATKEERERRKERRAEKRALKEYEESILKSPTYALPLTPAPMAGGLPPVTPRTLAFNRLDGSGDLPLRNHFSSPNPPGVIQQDVTVTVTESAGMGQNQPQIYFPPPPKKAAKK